MQPPIRVRDLRLSLRWLVPAVVSLLVAAAGNGYARAEGLTTIGAVRGRRQSRALLPVHRLPSAGSCCCAEGTADKPANPQQGDHEKAPGGSRPCLKAAPCGDAPPPVPGAPGRVSIPAMRVEPTHRDAASSSRSLVFSHSISPPSVWIAPLDDPPEPLS